MRGKRRARSSFQPVPVRLPAFHMCRWSDGLLVTMLSCGGRIQGCGRGVWTSSRCSSFSLSLSFPSVHRGLGPHPEPCLPPAYFGGSPGLRHIHRLLALGLGPFVSCWLVKSSEHHSSTGCPTCSQLSTSTGQPVSSVLRPVEVWAPAQGSAQNLESASIPPSPQPQRPAISRSLWTSPLDASASHFLDHQHGPSCLHCLLNCSCGLDLAPGSHSPAVGRQPESTPLLTPTGNKT